LNPLQGLTHTLTPSSINAQNRPKKLWIDLSWHALSPGYRSELTAALKSKNLATHGFQEIFQTHLLKPTEAEPSFRRINLPPAKLQILFPLTSRFVFWTQTTPFCWVGLLQDEKFIRIMLPANADNRVVIYHDSMSCNYAS